MSEAGRASLKLIFGSKPYKDWAAVPGNKTDANKIASEFNGIQRPKPGSAYAQGLVGLCRLNPPNDPPNNPPPVSEIAPVWQLDAAFVEGGLSNFAGPPRAHAYALGWRAVYTQLLHTSYAAANEAEIPVFVNAGWTIVGWGTYGQGSDPEQDGRDAAEICKRIPAIKGWKANGEAWAEQQYLWKTSAFVAGWVAGGAPVPLGWSVLSSDTANYARVYDYPSALAVVGADIDLQVYGATYPTYTVGAGLGMLAKAVPPVPVSRTTMTFDVNGDGNGPFPDYRTWAGPRRLWHADAATIATFDALTR